jgi:hypothetical protein
MPFQKGQAPTGRPFKPGQSGNPAGRPSRANLVKVLAQALMRPAMGTDKDGKEVPITRDGKPITEADAVVASWIRNAKKGKSTPLRLLLEYSEGKVRQEVRLDLGENAGMAVADARNELLEAMKALRPGGKPKAPPRRAASQGEAAAKP